MTRPFLVLLCFLIAAQIDGSLSDPRTHTYHPSHGVKHDGSRSKWSSLDDHQSQTRARAQRNHVHESNELSKEKDNFMNLENVLFDREQLKNYVLDYLRTHGFSKSPATGDKNLLDHKRKPGDRHNEHRDKLIRPSNHGRKHKHKDHDARVDNRGNLQSENNYNSKRNSLIHKKNSAGGHSKTSKHHDKLESQVRINHDTHENKKSSSLHKEHSINRQNFVSKEKRRHRDLSSQDHLEKHHSLKKYSIPIYFSIQDGNDKQSSVPSHHQYVMTNSKQNTRKHAVNSKQNGSTRNLRVKKHHKTAHQRSKHGNKNVDKVSSFLHRTKSNHKKVPRERFLKKEMTTHTDTSHQTLKHYHRSNRHGYLKRDKIASNSDVSSHSLKQKSKHKNTKGLNHKKSNKRDFIAVLPQQSVKLEGFDVQPVHPKLSPVKRKRKASKRQRHKDEKMNDSQQQLNKQGKKASRKSSVTSKSHDHEIKSQWQRGKRVGRKITVTQKSRGSADKDVNQHKAKIKSSVQPALSKHHPRIKEKNDLEHKKDNVHRKETSAAHKRKKISRHRDTKEAKFSPTWKSLDKRKIPSWYDDAKFGIFVHWGLYSVPSFDSEWFWYKWKGRQLQKYLNYTRKNFPPGFSYNEFAPLFKAEFFDAKQWAELVARSGARYFVFTSKHHEGFTNWNSSVAWNWNSVDIGPHRNIVDELARAFRNLSDPQVKFGLYYSLFEWFNPHYLKDKANRFKTDEYIKAVMRPQLYDLVNTYKPDYLWTDGDWEANHTYWRSTQFLAWLFNERDVDDVDAGMLCFSPVKDTVVVNDRWGHGCRCHHGGVYTGADRYNPGKLQKMKWENAMTIDRHSWGFRRDANLKDYLSIEELIGQLVSTVSCGGNLLMNVGPASDGTISPIFQERLTQMGDWLKVNGDAIYKTRPWRVQNDSVSGDVWYTSKGKEVFAITLSWPRSGKLVLRDPTVTDQTRVTMLGTKRHITWTHGSKHKGGKSGVVIHAPVIPVSDLPCLWAWVFKLSHVK